MIVVDTLCNADCQRTSALVEFRVVHRQETANVNHGVFLGRHCRHVSQGTDLEDDFAYGLVLVGPLALLYEKGVFGNTRHIVNEQHLVSVAPLAYLVEIFQRKRLSNGYVDACDNTDIRDVVRADFFNKRVEFVEVYIALERVSF